MCVLQVSSSLSFNNFSSEVTLLPTCYQTKCRELHTQDRMPLEQEKLFLCLPPQELTDLEIFAQSITRITVKIPKCDMP